MKEALIDTNILSLFFRGHPQVVAEFTAYVAEHSTIRFSIITYYEIVSGLKHRDAHKQLDSFLEFAAQSTIHPLTMQVADRTAELYADLRKRGEPIDDIDLLIAGTALANGLVLITENRRHFNRIVELEVENWAEAPNK
jgi:tRNA(fMet)-specific endonuclease VapC